MKAMAFLRCLLLCWGVLAIATAQAQVQQSYQLQTTLGWNLLGNSIDKAISVSTTFGDTSKVTSVWKWDNAGNRWMFYSPSLTTADLQTFTASNGYGVLTTIEGGEGYWVNAKTATDYGTQTGLGAITPKLAVGWNLIASGGTADSKDVSVEMYSHIVKKTVDVVSVWTWKGTGWGFYAPSLYMDGSLGSYQAANNMGAISGSVSGSGKGFWVKGNGVVAVTPKAVFKTSDENKHNIDLDNPTFIQMSEINNIDSTITRADGQQGWSGRAFAFADFMQDGTYSVIAAAHVNRNVYPKFNPNGYADSPAKLYFLRKSADGKWMDTTTALISDDTSRYTCVTPTYMEVADFNNDKKPDVFVACTGIDYPSP